MAPTTQLPSTVAGGPPQHSIAHLAANNQPLVLPWSPGMPCLAPGTMFHSRLCTTPNPWGTASPWDPRSIQAAQLAYRRDDGGYATFQSLETTSSTTEDEHLSVSFGITAGCPFLNASVTGAYDKDTKENKDERKVSTRASFRAGTISLQSRPALSADGLVVLKHQGGISAFKSRFGDYYVAGYRLGGDAAVMLSESASVSSKRERLSVTVSVQLLFFKVSTTYAKFFSSADASSAFRVSGFDTLSRTLVPAADPVAVDGGASTAMQELALQAKAIEDLCIKLPRRVWRQLKAAGLDHEQDLSWGELHQLLESDEGSCLVVEMILLPITSLRPVVEWSMSLDVIGSG